MKLNELWTPAAHVSIVLARWNQWMQLQEFFSISQFNMNFTDTKTWFAENFHTYIHKTQIFVIWGFRSTLKDRILGNRGFWVTTWYSVHVLSRNELMCAQSYGLSSGKYTVYGLWLYSHQCAHSRQRSDSVLTLCRLISKLNKLWKVEDKPEILLLVEFGVLWYWIPKKSTENNLVTHKICVLESGQVAHKNKTKEIETWLNFLKTHKIQNPSSWKKRVLRLKRKTCSDFGKYFLKIWLHFCGGQDLLSLNWLLLELPQLPVISEFRRNRLNC